jgi:hypothetical protein
LSLWENLMMKRFERFYITWSVIRMLIKILAYIKFPCTKCLIDLSRDNLKHLTEIFFTFVSLLFDCLWLLKLFLLLSLSSKLNFQYCSSFLLEYFFYFNFKVLL